MTAHVEFLKGLELPGFETSPGIIDMAREVSSWAGYTAVVREWHEWEKSVDALKSLPVGIRRGVVGYSNGGSMATYIANSGTVIDFLVGMDATTWIPPKQLQINVRNAICFWNVNPFSSFPPVGHASYSLVKGNTSTKLLTYKIMNLHGNVDTDPDNQKLVYEALKSLSTT